MRAEPKRGQALPSKASDLLDMAVDDALAVKAAGHGLDMGRWVSRPRKGPCTVCMAGAVMLRRCAFDRRRVYLAPSRVAEGADSDTALRLRAINRLRLGEFGYVGEAGSEGGIAAMALIRADFSERRDGGRAKWSTYRKAAQMLRAAGL